jgi:uncharacterized protein YutE (UPF0331/DUF86 family)
VAPEVRQRKLRYLEHLLADLEPFRQASLAEVEQAHYTVERILELLAMTATDLTFHLLAERGLQPQTYREGFRLAGEQGLLSPGLAQSLQAAAGLRNVLAHLYDDLDFEILHASVGVALETFRQFLDELTPE